MEGFVWAGGEEQCYHPRPQQGRDQEGQDPAG